MDPLAPKRSDVDGKFTPWYHSYATDSIAHLELMGADPLGPESPRGHFQLRCSGRDESGCACRCCLYRCGEVKQASTVAASCWASSDLLRALYVSLVLRFQALHDALVPSVLLPGAPRDRLRRSRGAEGQSQCTTGPPNGRPGGSDNADHDHGSSSIRGTMGAPRSCTLTLTSLEVEGRQAAQKSCLCGQSGCGRRQDDIKSKYHMLDK